MKANTYSSTTTAEESVPKKNNIALLYSTSTEVYSMIAVSARINTVHRCLTSSN